MRPYGCDGINAGDAPRAEVMFRLCRLMLARKVLWDEDIGLDLQQFASALDSTPATVAEILGAMQREGWVVVDARGECPSLTPSGVAAILGRRWLAAH